MNGILNINKPRGNTSFSIVAFIKRLTSEQRVGHGGTLDPLATGVLPIFVGRATRVTEYLSETNKTYQAKVEFGITTDTYDATGKIIDRKDLAGITRQRITSALKHFCGQIKQIPPMYSALKHDGTPLYKLARAQITIERQPRLIQIYRLKLMKWQTPELTLEIECGKGTYIRSLAHDIGQFLGCGAHLTHLVRTSYGPFQLATSISVSNLRSVTNSDDLGKWLLPIDTVLTKWPAITLNETEVNNIGHGRPIETTALPSHINIDESRYRAYNSDGIFIATLRKNDKHQLHPEKVFI